MSYRNPDADTNYLAIIALVLMTMLLLMLIFNQPEPTVELKVKEWRCLEEHTENDPTIVSTGDITFTVPGTKQVCDHWIRRR